MFVEGLKKEGHERVLSVIDEARSGAQARGIEPLRITYDRVLSAFEISDFVEDFYTVQDLKAQQVLERFAPSRSGCASYVVLGALSVAALPFRLGYYGLRACGRGVAGFYRLFRKAPELSPLIDELVKDVPVPEMPQPLFEELLEYNLKR